MNELFERITALSKAAVEIERMSQAYISKLEEEKETVFAKGTPVLCRNLNDIRVSRIYSHFEDGKHFCFSHGANQYNTGGDALTWNNVEHDLKAPAQLNWIDNTGKEPDCTLVKIKYSDGSVSAGFTTELTWEMHNGIAKYASLDE